MTSLAQNLEYSEKDEEVFEVYSRLRLDGNTKQQSLISLMIMDYKITPSILDAIKTYDKLFRISNSYDYAIELSKDSNGSSHNNVKLLFVP